MNEHSTCLYVALAILLCLLSERVRLFLLVAIFGVTGAQGNHGWMNPIAAWDYAGALLKIRREG